ncbi:RNA methyltransferase [Coprothermobacteraceae bacterium]|nr:RNA methyltransferase [Coprothermobacteraceae bacterium]
MYDKEYKVVVTSVTNLDIHDIARLSRTYSLSDFWVVTPVKAQQEMIERILSYWNSDAGKAYNPHRAEALSLVRIAESLDAVSSELQKRYGRPPKLVATDARPYPNMVDYEFVRNLVKDEEPVVLILGTGHGIAYEVIQRMDYFLAPIRPKADYNHLSVRSAASILVDRIIGDGL